MRADVTVVLEVRQSIYERTLFIKTVQFQSLSPEQYYYFSTCSKAQIGDPMLHILFLLYEKTLFIKTVQFQSLSTEQYYYLF